MHMTKNVGKPYEGKLHVRFDEGELKVLDPSEDGSRKSVLYSTK